MSHIRRYRETYNADNEEPNCLRCNHVCDRYDSFCLRCGPENWWHNYIRTEVREIEVEDEDEKRLKAIVSGKKS